MRVALGIPVAVVVGLLVLTAPTPIPSPSTTSGPTPGPTAPTPTPAPTPVPTARPGSALLRGTVRLAGEGLPEPTRIANTTDPEACGREQSRRDLLVSPENRGIRNAIVSVAGVPEDAVPTAAPGRVILDNRDCRFEPRAAVATVGSMLETVNRDPVLHTVHLYGARQENLALPEQGTTRSVRLDSPGMITILCDVHGWMRAYVRVDPHPYHAVTDADGRFRIPDVPAGTREVEIWHERLGRRSRTVRLAPGAVEEIEITYSMN